MTGRPRRKVAPLVEGRGGASRCLGLPPGLTQDLPEGVPGGCPGRVSRTSSSLPLSARRPCRTHPSPQRRSPVPSPRYPAFLSAARLGEALEDLRVLRRVVQGVDEDGARCPGGPSRGPWPCLPRPEPYLVEIGVDADLDETHEFREHGGMGPEVSDDRVDLVDLEFRDVELQGDVLTGCKTFRNTVVGRWWILNTMRTSSLSMGLRGGVYPAGT